MSDMDTVIWAAGVAILFVAVVVVLGLYWFGYLSVGI